MAGYPFAELRARSRLYKKKRSGARPGPTEGQELAGMPALRNMHGHFEKG